MDAQGGETVKSSENLLTGTVCVCGFHNGDESLKTGFTTITSGKSFVRGFQHPYLHCPVQRHFNEVACLGDCIQLSSTTIPKPVISKYSGSRRINK